MTAKRSNKIQDIPRRQASQLPFNVHFLCITGQKVEFLGVQESMLTTGLRSEITVQIYLPRR